jgi:hypothetical protein
MSVRPAAPRPADVTPVDAARADAERAVLDELTAWRERAVPDPAAPLDADDLVALLRDCMAVLRLDPAIASGFTVNTVHYYRRKDVIDPPDGRTAAARYGVRHLWQIAGARLAGHLGLVTLAEARAVMRDADEPTLVAFLAARVTDARARDAVRAPAAASSVGAPNARPNAAGPGVMPNAARALPAYAAAPLAPPAMAPVPATMIPLPGDAWCVVPASHAAHHSADAAHDLAHALASALVRGLRAGPHRPPPPR